MPQAQSVVVFAAPPALSMSRIHANKVTLHATGPLRTVSISGPIPRRLHIWSITGQQRCTAHNGPADDKYSQVIHKSCTSSSIRKAVAPLLLGEIYSSPNICLPAHAPEHDNTSPAVSLVRPTRPDHPIGPALPTLVKQCLNI